MGRQHILRFCRTRQPNSRGDGAARLRTGTTRRWGIDSCAATADHEVFCWGWNLAGQLGDGQAATQGELPVAVFGL